MALRYGEYRESVDIDFLVSRIEGYRQLRQRLTGPDGLQAITRAGYTLTQVREVRADQYGIRSMLRVDEVDIKFEKRTWPRRSRTFAQGRTGWTIACGPWA